MVTRFIKKNTPTQVNADRIGVQVKQDAPELLGIDASYNYTTANVIDNIDDARLMQVTSGSVYMRYGKEDVEIDDVTYYAWDLFDSFDDNDPQTIFTTTEILGSLAGSTTYTYDDVAMTSFGTVQNAFTQLDTMTQVGESTLDDGSRTYTIWEGEKHQTYIYREEGTNYPKFIGLLDSTSLVENASLYFANEGLDEETGKYVWTNEDNGYSLYTDEAVPEEGGKAIFSLVEEDYNQQDVIDLVYDEIHPIACTVSYSVTGDVFTDHPTTLTDDNNVICNIPRYMYLKFSQDVNITEE